MFNSFHSKILEQRWPALSLYEQLGNIGSEVGRAATRSERKEITARDQAVTRALELLDYTIVDPRWRNHLKEFCRARELLVDTFWGTHEYGDTPKNLEKYFFQFALAARLQR
ncbi:MAG: hypothetical protein HY984_01375 [Candidatus Magasanikbacteria bacterium]|nr:hypothetical protein [Candidatus Magasanikbacteria bacterium]